MKPSEKKGKYSHKERPKYKDDEKNEIETNDEKKNPNNGNYNDNDKKRKKRKKYVIYTEAEHTSTSLIKEEEITKDDGKLQESVMKSDNENQLDKSFSNENVKNDINEKIVSNLSIVEDDKLDKKIQKIKNTKSAKEMSLEILEEKKRKEERKKDKAVKMMDLNKREEGTGKEEGEEGDEIEIDAEDVLDTDDVSRKGGRGTFSVGCLPKPLMSPKGNVLFPGSNLIFSILSHHRCFLNSWLLFRFEFYYLDSIFII